MGYFYFCRNCKIWKNFWHFCNNLIICLEMRLIDGAGLKFTKVKVYLFFFLSFILFVCLCCTTVYLFLALNLHLSVCFFLAFFRSLLCFYISGIADLSSLFVFRSMFNFFSWKYFDIFLTKWWHELKSFWVFKDAALNSSSVKISLSLAITEYY
jgi:hypothetical protein